MAAAPNFGNHSPRTSGDGAVNSIQSRRGTAVRGVSSPWTQIVRGGESESMVSPAAAPSSPPPSAAFEEQTIQASDWPPSKVAASSSNSPEESEVQPECSPDGSRNSNAAKKPAWNKPSNEPVEVGPVMGAVSWPALSESTKASAKSLSSELLKGLPDGSVAVSQGTALYSPKQITSNNANLNHSTSTSTRQKSSRRGGGSSGGGNASLNGGFPQSPPSSIDSVIEMPSNNTSGKPLVSSPRDHTHSESGGIGSQSLTANNDHVQPQHRNSNRRGNSGSHYRADGYHHNYGTRRDQDRGNHDWNFHRNFNRDFHGPPPRVSRGFIRPPPPSPPPFIHPPSMPMPVRPFGNSMVYPEVASPMIYLQQPPPESLRGVPIVAPLPPPTMFFSVPDPQLHIKILNQIDYYFSNDNLIKDIFLRQNMDDQGWVPIKLIAGFKKVMQLTENIKLILDVVRASTIVEVQGDKVRKRHDWKRWVMPRVQFPTVSSPQLHGKSGDDMLAAGVQGISLEENTDKHCNGETSLSRSSSCDLNSQSQPSGGGANSADLSK